MIPADQEENLEAEALLQDYDKRKCQHIPKIVEYKRMSKKRNLKPF